MITIRTAAKTAAITAGALLGARVIQCTIWEIKWAIEDRARRAEERTRNIEFAGQLNDWAADKDHWAAEFRARGDHATASEYEAEADRQRRAANALLAKRGQLGDAITILHPELA